MGTSSIVAPRLGEESLRAGEVERRAHGQDEMVRAGSQEVVDAVRVLGVAEYHASLDLTGITAHPPAPLVQQAVLPRERLDRSEAVPDVGVLGGESKRHPLALAADEDRHTAERRRDELA